MNYPPPRTVFIYMHAEVFTSEGHESVVKIPCRVFMHRGTRAASKRWRLEQVVLDAKIPIRFLRGRAAKGNKDRLCEIIGHAILRDMELPNADDIAGFQIALNRMWNDALAFALEGEY